MIWLSILLVAGSLALMGLNLSSGSPNLTLGAGLLIEGRVPWVLLAVLWGGVALAGASLFRGRKLLAGILGNLGSPPDPQSSERHA